MTSTTVRPGGVSGRMEVPTTPGVVESCSNQAANSALSAFGVGDDGDGVGAACREPVGEGEGDVADLG